MITRDELKLGYLSGRKKAYDKLPSARVESRIPFARVNSVNLGQYDSLEMLVAEDSGHMIEMDPSPTEPVVLPASAVGSLPKWLLPVAAIAGGLWFLKKKRRKRRG